jgi:hypothetical protein
VKNCRDCLNYAPGPAGSPGGECRRKAPKLAPEGSAYALRDGAPYGYWPIVQATQWCGEFRARDRSRA